MNKVNNTLYNVVDNFMGQLKETMKNSPIMQSNMLGGLISGEISLESEEGLQAKKYISSFEEQIDATIDLIVSSEEMKNKNVIFTDAQRAAAKLIAPIAADPVAYGRKMTKLNPVVSTSSNAMRFSAEELGVDEIADIGLIQAEISNEAYDGQKKNNALFYSIAYNLGAARQDEFSETFFRTIAIDPLQEGIKISQEFTSIYKEFDRSRAGTPDAEKFNRLPLIKEIYNKDIFAVDKHKLVPVYEKDTNDDFFITDVSYVDQTSGQDITTCPLVFGKTVSLLGISQTDDILAKGVMDNTDALDRTLKLEQIFYSIGNEYFSFNAQLYPYSNFVGTTQGHHKDLQLAFNPDFAINISNLKTWDGSTPTAFDSVNTTYADYIVILNVTIFGQVNTMTSDLTVNVGKLNLKEIRTGGGQLVATTDAAYSAIKAIVDTISFVGYTIEAYRTNSNVRTRGRLVSADIFEDIIIAPYRAGVTVINPINNAMGTDNDVGLLTSQILLSGFITSNYAVKTLVDFESSMNLAKTNGTLDRLQFNGIGRYFINPYFNSLSFDVTSIVDSIQSADRADDIRQALRLKIKEEVLKMVTESNYGVAFEVIRKGVGGRISVIIGTDVFYRSLICKDDNKFIIDGTDIEARVVSTWNNEIKGKIYVTFGIFDESSNQVVNPLNFGNCIWSPTISYEVVKTHGGAVNKELHNNPRFIHIINLPILSVFNISDATGVFDKISINVNTSSD